MFDMTDHRPERPERPAPSHARGMIHGFLEQAEAFWLEHFKPGSYERSGK